MIIARAILNLEKTKKEIYAGNPWVNHSAEVKNYFLEIRMSITTEFSILLI